MRGFYKFVTTAIARSLGSTCVSAVLLGVGMSPDKIARWFPDSPPWLLGTWWFPYIVALVAILIIAWIFYKQSLFDQARPLPFNVSMEGLVKYLRTRSSWGISENPHSPLSSENVFVEIRQKVRDGHIELHGRRSNDSSSAAFDGPWMQTWEPITRRWPDYWDHMQVSGMAIVHATDLVEETEPINTLGSASDNLPRFTQLRASWPQILIAWPSTNIIQRIWKGIKLWRAANT